MAGPKRLKFARSYFLAASADGSMMAALGRNVTLLSTAELRKVGSVHPLSHPSWASFSGDGTKLAVKNTAGRIVVLAIPSLEVLCDHSNRREGEGSELHFSPCGKFLVDGSWGDFITVREALRPVVVDRFEFEGEMITDISHSSNSQVWLMTHKPRTRPGEDRSPPGYLTVWSWPLKTPLETIEPALSGVESGVVSPDGRRIALVGYEESPRQSFVQVLSITGRELARTPIEIGGTGSRLRWSPNGALIGSIQRGRIVTYASADLSEVKSYPFEYPSDICFSENDSYIAFATWSFGILKRTEAATPNHSIDPTPDGAAHVER
jgi:hypothetical protein